MESTTSLLTSEAAASVVVDSSHVVSENFTPLCWACLDHVRRHPEDEADPGIVRFSGKWTCGFHAWFHYRDQPARVFALLDLVVNT